MELVLLARFETTQEIVLRDAFTRKGSRFKRGITLHCNDVTLGYMNVYTIL